MGVNNKIWSMVRARFSASPSSPTQTDDPIVGPIDEGTKFDLA